jgi:hypothetical protein
MFSVGFSSNLQIPFQWLSQDRLKWKKSPPRSKRAYGIADGTEHIRCSKYSGSWNTTRNLRVSQEFHIEYFFLVIMMTCLEREVNYSSFTLKRFSQRDDFLLFHFYLTTYLKYIVNGTESVLRGNILKGLTNAQERTYWCVHKILWDTR